MLLTLRVVHSFYAVQICFADFAARMASTVGNDIHFLPTKELNSANAFY